MTEIEAKKVSIIARSKEGFVSIYHHFGEDLPAAWAKKRDNFIKRTFAAYKLNPTRRRYLSLICWAFDPDA